MRICVFLFLVLCCPALRAEDGEHAPLFRVGFSRRLFTDVNENDAKASIRAWAQTVAHERGIHMDPVAQLYDRVAEMIAAIRNDEVDAISVLFDEYLVLSPQVEISNRFMTQVNGSLFEEYLLLIHVDSPIYDLSTLQGRCLALHSGARMCLAVDWLDTLLLSNGWSGTDGFFKEVRKLPKLSPTVLQVFFRQADACVVAKSGFNTLCELNPQLRSKLKVLAFSPPLAPALLCFRGDFESPEKSKIMAAFEGLHETLAGQQVLTIFKAEKLVPITADQLADTKSFLIEAARLRSAANPGQSVESATGSTRFEEARP
jgi:ABC-type phosphate/phosphonate transport system substrate-binding protein